MTVRSLAQWLTYLEQLHPHEIELGLTRIQAVAERLRVLQPAPRIITVTGTNGKGSTCTFIAELLRVQKLNVGLYSSPHFLRYNERIQVNGQAVSDEQLCQAFSVVEQARQGIRLTYFEMGTLAALWLFSTAGLDAVVLEVGLGGRLDAVNIVDADVAVITTVALDHSDWLGNTRDSVAFEKAGIFRSHKPALCGDLQPPSTLLEHARSISTPLLLRGRDFDLAVTDHCWHWRGVDAQSDVLTLENLPLLKLPVESAALALQVCALLDLPWQPQQIVQALSQARLTGRLQELHIRYQNQNRTIILDVAHNPHAAQYLADWLVARPLAGKRYAVFGALADKDVAGVITAIAEQINHWAISELPSPRTFRLSTLESCLRQAGRQVDAYRCVAEALEAQLQSATTDDEILVFGSFFTVTQALEYLQSM